MRNERNFGRYVAPSEASRSELDKLGIDRQGQDRVYEALAKAAEKLAATQEWRENLDFHPIAVGSNSD